ncbi:MULTISPECIES: barstar family protein [Actinoplanes]|uniref:barstar family protein n=1 Tax=Actinoplanes TaxID=1865 RepID=UPI0005F2D710|nr:MULTISPECIES: barstar family protein [Actinoplanes]GLX99642.1 hypothetical protein Acsp01_00220 [Actinoplanes sp. NBRC 101535]
MSGFPWLLVDQNTDDGSDAVIAACADIDGLFVDPPQPPVERYELLGCAPEGRLLAACDGSGPVRLGNLGVAAVHRPDSPHGPECWDCAEELLDVTVLGAGPSIVVPGLFDVTLEGRFRVDETGSPSRNAEKAPDADGFLLAGITGHGDEPFGDCQDVAGVFRHRNAPAPRPATLIGCRPEPSLKRAIDALRRGAPRRRFINASIFHAAYDGTAIHVLGSGLGAEVSAVRPSALGEGLYDVELRSQYGDAIGGPRPTRAREIWDLWRVGRPTEVNLWSGYDTELRHEWAGAALAHHRQAPDRPADTTFHLDGRHVTDEEGFYCAIGEAINGPAGYFGWNLGALHDCAGGGWGAEPGFRLVWHDAQVAREHLVPGYDRYWWEPAVTMDDVLGLLDRDGVRVELM